MLKTKFAEIAVCVAATPDTPSAPLVTETAHAAKGYDLDVTVPADRVTGAARIMDEAAFMLEAITGVDWMAEQQFEIVYDYTAVALGARVVVRARVPRATPELPTISRIYPGANWHEREAHDFFGIVFTGHPELIPLLLPEDADFHPLRKDFGA
ncbi:MAG: NADH-quinone oxidoreductase subunit C [Verrucomicrobia bacterium]|nr:MAG: NADH-quinone oxidoreductase subunit C [Verrucomicrobiota bacterium]